MRSSVAASFCFRFFGGFRRLPPGKWNSLFHNRELKPAFLREDAIENDLYPVAGAETTPPTLAYDFVGVLAPGIAIVKKTLDRDKAFDEEFGEFDEEAVFRGIENEGGEFFANSILHEADLLPFDKFPLGLSGAAFGLTGLFGDLSQFGFGYGWLALESFAATVFLRVMDNDTLQALVGVGPGRSVAAFSNICAAVHSRTEQGFGDAVDDEVRIAADGRREVGVSGSSECEMTLIDF